jgi:hypothetical protein
MRGCVLCWVRGLRRRASGTFGRRPGKYALQQLLYLCTTRWYSLENRTNRHGASKYRSQRFFHQLTNGFNSREAVCTEAPASESRGLADQSARCLSGRWRSLCENPRIVYPTARANSHSQPDRECPDTLPHHEEQQLMPRRSQSHANAKFMGPLPTEYAMTP